MTAPSDAVNDHPPETTYAFRLFVAGDGTNSRQAKQNLAALCNGELKGKCRTEIVNVLEDFEAASKHGILLTPTLLSLPPGPKAQIVGNLDDRHKIRTALRLDPSPPSQNEAP